jgi:hypothetical protein
MEKCRKMMGKTENRLNVVTKQEKPADTSSADMRPGGGAGPE